MRRRIYGLETEYAIALYPDRQLDVEPQSQETMKRIIACLSELLVRDMGLPGSQFMVNGGRFYDDVGHGEWSLPECSSAREAACYDKAADATLMAILPEAEALLAERGLPGRLVLLKNNTDTMGSSYGCHENYLTERQSDWLQREDHQRLLTRVLMPFLVTRHVYAGSGRVGLGTSVQGPRDLGFQILQRADFIQAAVSIDTRERRAIVNHGREFKPLASGNARRLHLIFSDSNMSGWANMMKLGTTALVLRMFEDLWLSDVPDLADPVLALHEASRDLSCQLPLRDGGLETPLSIQRRYLDAAQRYVIEYGASAEEQVILAAWQEALDALATQPQRLFGKVDWITKQRILDQALAQAETSWEEIAAEGCTDELRFGLLRTDIDYHLLSEQHGLYYRLFGARSDPWLDADELAAAVATPPAYTRAHIRGDFVAAARRYSLPLKVEGWDSVELDGRRIELGDPLAFFSVEAQQALDAVQAQQETPLVLLEALEEGDDPELRCQAVRGLVEARAGAALGRLLELYPEVRERAPLLEVVTALGVLGSGAPGPQREQCEQALAELANHRDPCIRWRAQEAYGQLLCAAPSPPSPLSAAP